MEFDPAPLSAERVVQSSRPTQEIDPAKLIEAMRDAERTPAVEPAHPNTKRREK
jgi:hypothetical protein